LPQGVGGYWLGNLVNVFVALSFFDFASCFFAFFAVTEILLFGKNRVAYSSYLKVWIIKP
jgi:hypothetical protein